jgi:D-alanyl-D-alanine carboxypeptidase (penicillin-binding protein 5/6)
MNGEAEALGLEDTSFQNPIGLDTNGQYSSARDLAEMTRLAMEYPEFRELIATDYATIITQDREIPLTNTNNLLFIDPLATGVKTRTTPAAGPSLVSSAAENESYVSVVLNAKEDRFAASIRTLENGFAAYDRGDLIHRGEQYARAHVPFRRGETVDLVAREDVDGLVDGTPTSSARLECRRICSAPRGPERSSARSWSRRTGSGSGRARSWSAGATTRPRCGSACGIQSGGSSRRGVG